ncbi:cytochrome c5 [Psychrobacter sp. PL19]|uniref:c-type cytochrome n=1 Tax=Psychrobacter sp. PL19 TaxID=2760711 RepID=UPI002FF24EFD
MNMTIKEEVINKQDVMNKNSVAKLALSALSLSLLLTLSACSGEDNTATDETAAVSDTETAVVAVEEPVVNTEEAATSEVAEPAVVEAPMPTAAVTAEPIATETELLAVDAGAKLYESNCQVCHQNGLLNAPKYGDVVAWAPRLAKGKETLYTHSAKGFNKMPAQANDEVSEAQVHAAVDYMIAAVS